MARNVDTPEFLNINEAIAYLEAIPVSEGTARVARICRTVAQKLIEQSGQSMHNDATWSREGILQVADLVTRLQGVLISMDSLVTREVQTEVVDS